MPPDWFLSDEQINALKVDPLKEGGYSEGKKEHLRVTLKQCVEKKMPIVEGVTKDMQVLSGFPIGSKWRELQPSDIARRPTFSGIIVQRPQQKV